MNQQPERTSRDIERERTSATEAKKNAEAELVKQQEIIVNADKLIAILDTEAKKSEDNFLAAFKKDLEEFDGEPASVLIPKVQTPETGTPIAIKVAADTYIKLPSAAPESDLELTPLEKKGDELFSASAGYN